MEIVLITKVCFEPKYVKFYAICVENARLVGICIVKTIFVSLNPLQRALPGFDNNIARYSEVLHCGSVVVSVCALITQQYAYMVFHL